MFRHFSRWRWLTLLAVGNLVFWLLVAAGVGLMASREVDLGVETLLRMYRATAVAAWNQASSPALDSSSRPVTEGQAPKQASTPSAASTPTASIVWPAAESPPPSSNVQVTESSAQGTTPTPLPSSPPPAPEAPQTPVSSPLLMANPELRDPARMDAEMSHSAIGRPVQIRYHEATLNQEIAALVESNPGLPYDNVRVELKRDLVVLTGSATVLGFPVSTEVVGTVEIENCLPQIEIQSISIAGVMTPSFVQEQIEHMLLDALAWYPPDYPLCLEQIVLEEGRATVYGSRR